jgi:uncharacterized membrane protein
LVSERYEIKLRKPNIYSWSRAKFWGIFALTLLPLLIAHLFRHWGLLTHGYDVGFVNQPLFYPFAEAPMWCVLCTGKSYLAEHLTLSFYLLAPITSLFKSDELIIVLQFLIVVIPCLILIFKGPLKEFKDLWPMALIIIVSHRSLRNGLIFDFREDQIAFMGFLLTCILIHKHKYFYSLIPLLIAVASKENMALIAPFLCFPLIFDKNLNASQKKRYLLSFIIISFSFLWLWGTFSKVMPYFAGGAQTQSVILLRLPGLGSTPLEIIQNAIFNPLPLLSFIFESIFSFEHFKYLLILLLPTCLFTWRAWPWMIPAIPGIAMNLISAVPNQRTMLFHYDFCILPFIFFACVKGMSLTPKEKLKKNAWAIILFCLILIGRPPTQKLYDYAPTMLKNWRSAHFLNSISGDQPTAASMPTVAQLTHLKNLRVFNLKKGEETIKADLMKNNFSLSDVERFIIDKNSQKEASLLNGQLKEKGFRIEKIGPNKRFVILKR